MSATFKIGKSKQETDQIINLVYNCLNTFFKPQKWTVFCLLHQNQGDPHNTQYKSEKGRKTDDLAIICETLCKGGILVYLSLQSIPRDGKSLGVIWYCNPIKTIYHFRVVGNNIFKNFLTEFTVCLLFSKSDKMTVRHLDKLESKMSD